MFTISASNFHPPLTRSRFSFRLSCSTHPVGGGTHLDNRHGTFSRISIHPPRGGWDLGGQIAVVFGGGISIHPPRGGWDLTKTDYDRLQANFNPPTPWGVGHDGEAKAGPLNLFQSTHPAGGWDARIAPPVQFTRYFNPPTPRGGGTHNFAHSSSEYRISIHPPRGGVGPAAAVKWFLIGLFQSTHPAGGWDTSRRPHSKL